MPLKIPVISFQGEAAQLPQISEAFKRESEGGLIGFTLLITFKE